jgi:hypothetical protein
MKLGKYSWSESVWKLTSWRSADDPTPGDYSRTLESSGLPELVLWYRGVKKFRTGPWNGRWFNGVPDAAGYSDKYPLHVITTATETTYGYTAVPGASLTRVVVNFTGVAQRLVWHEGSGAWIPFFTGPDDDCDNYARCGPFGLCNPGAAPHCVCVPGFIPASPLDWNNNKVYTRGCRPDAVLDGGGETTTDIFKVIAGVKLPDTQNASVNMSVTTLQECRQRCLADGSCLAYAGGDIRGGGNPTGCVIWTDSIVDLRYVNSSQDLYLRLPKSGFGKCRLSIQSSLPCMYFILKEIDLIYTESN